MFTVLGNASSLLPIRWLASWCCLTMLTGGISLYYQEWITFRACFLDSFLWCGVPLRDLGIRGWQDPRESGMPLTHSHQYTRVYVMSGITDYPSLPSKHEALAQCWANASCLLGRYHFEYNVLTVQTCVDSEGHIGLRGGGLEKVSFLFFSAGTIFFGLTVDTNFILSWWENQKHFFSYLIVHYISY